MVKVEKDPKPYHEICCSRCWVAKSETKKCKCRCRGAHHGEALKPDAKKAENSCPKCGSKFVVATPHVWSPIGKITYVCGICSHWWYKPKT